MPIPNPIDKGVKGVKAVPKKVWVIAIGGGVVIYLVIRQRGTSQNTTDTADASGGFDALASPASDYSGTPSQGALPAVDLTPQIDSVNGVPAIDDTATSIPDSGEIVINLVSEPAADGATGSDVTPGPSVSTNGVKTVTTKRIATLADLPYADRKKIQEERAAGNVDRYGRTPTERSAARKNAGIAAQLRARLERQRAKPKAGGGAPKRGHPKDVHGGPKRSPKRKSPPAHIHAAPKSHTPKNQPTPKRRRKARSRA